LDSVLETQAAKAGKQPELKPKAKKTYVTVSARVNAATKQSAQSILANKGLTISKVFQRTLEDIARTGKVPHKTEQELSKEEIKRRVAAVMALQLPEPCNLTDDEVREMRLKEKYGVDFNA
jgi:antitoxin component of RelBE/YafQ-DinJ toxin-antitoxin module